MQTFLPFPDFEETAKCLDYRRLGKQRPEAMGIYNILTGKTTTNGWRNHPAVKMWIGHEQALAQYYNTIVSEWIKRGYKNNMPFIAPTKIIMPWWIGNKDFHDSHKCRLLQKDEGFYSKYNWKVNKELKYLWADNQTQTFRICE
jgi:hypothetical protein